MTSATILATNTEFTPGMERLTDYNLISPPKKSTDQCAYELLYICIYHFISCLCERKKKVDPGGQNEAGMPSRNLSCKAASTSEASSCVRLHVSTGLGGCGAKNHWDVLIWSHLGWTNRSQADMWLAATPRGRRSGQISANLGRHGMSLYTWKEGALAYNPYLLRPLKFFSLT